MESWIELGLPATPEAAWEALIRRYGASLAGRVRRTLRRSGLRPRSDQVEEIVQEVYCRLLAGGGCRLRQCRATQPAQVGAFLGKVAERVTLDHLRAAHARKRGGREARAALPRTRAEPAAVERPAEAAAASRGTAHAAAPAADAGLGGALAGEPWQLVDPRRNPEELILERERMRLALRRYGALGGLREARRNARILALAWSGWTSGEIARVVGGKVTARTIQALLRRIRRRAREKL